MYGEQEPPSLVKPPKASLYSSLPSEGYVIWAVLKWSPDSDPFNPTRKCFITLLSQIKNMRSRVVK